MKTIQELSNSENTKKILENFNTIQQKVEAAAQASARKKDEIKILAVSKTHPAEVLLQSLSAGINVFAENYAQEFRDKNKIFRERLEQEEHNLPTPEIHFIGHLQRNKVKYIVPFVDMLHTIDSIKLAEEVNKQAEKNNLTLDVLLQVNTSDEEAKSGIKPDNVEQLANEVLLLNNLNLKGLMTIGTFSDNEKIIRSEFTLLRKTLETLNKNLGLNLKELSMGMSHDFEIAIDEQATMVRIGTAIFGNRTYKSQ